MKQLIEDIAKALVDIPEEVAVNVVEGEQVTVLELKVAPSDLGKVIGKQGRTARSIRTMNNERYILSWFNACFDSEEIKRLATIEL